MNEVLTQSKPSLEKFLDSKSVSYWPSSANFLFCFPENSEEVLEHLTKNDILVRPKKDAEGRLGLRISLGTLPQTNKLISVLESVL